MRRACDKCHGTDTQRECEQGQCYAEEYEREQQEAWNIMQQRGEEEYWRRRAADEPSAG